MAAYDVFRGTVCCDVSACCPGLRCCRSVPVRAPITFTRARSITFVIGSAPGGGYDTYSRLVASHLGQHLEGRPTIIPQNMPGAGSIRAANYLYNIAPKDGTAIGMVDEAIYLNQILGAPGADDRRSRAQLDSSAFSVESWERRSTRTDAAKFNWIGRILANSAVLFARRRGFACRRSKMSSTRS